MRAVRRAQGDDPDASRTADRERTVRARWRDASPVAPVRYPLDLGGTLRALAGGGGVLGGTLSASGEDALALALGSAVDLGDLPAGATVVVPDFICSSVPRAVARAGLRVAFGALDATRWTFAAGALDAALDAGARALVAVSYFGLPAGGDDAGRAELATAARAAYAVEDLAQGYGIAHAARLDGARAATFSFGRGKSLPLGWGGLVEAADERTAARVAARAAAMPPARALESAANLLLAQAQRALLHPLVWRLVPLPAPPLRGVAAPAPPEPTAAPHRRRTPGRLVARYLAAAADRHVVVVEQRRRNALELRDRLLARVTQGVVVPAATSVRAGVALRLPVLLDDERAGRAVRAALERRGIVKGPNDWDDYAAPSANAASIAARLVTLPTHPGSEHAAARAVETIAEILGL